VGSDLELPISSDRGPRKAGGPVGRIIVLLRPEDNQRAFGRLILHEQLALDGVADFFRRAAVTGAADGGGEDAREDQEVKRPGKHESARRGREFNSGWGAHSEYSEIVGRPG